MKVYLNQEKESESDKYLPYLPSVAQLSEGERARVFFSADPTTSQLLIQPFKDRSNFVRNSHSCCYASLLIAFISENRIAFQIKGFSDFV